MARQPVRVDISVVNANEATGDPACVYAEVRVDIPPDPKWLESVGLMLYMPKEDIRDGIAKLVFALAAETRAVESGRELWLS